MPRVGLGRGLGESLATADGGVRGVIAQLNVLRRSTRPGGYAPIQHEVLEAAQGHLEELYGDAFVAWRCTDPECSNMTVDIGKDGNGVGVETVLTRMARVDGDGAWYMRCTHLRHGPRGVPMERVVCRVTADDPARYAGGGDPVA